MKAEIRKVMDFIMGGCAGYCFFFGGILGNGLGILMILTFVISTYKTRMLTQIDKDIKADLEENKTEESK
jgi:hypothetical protein